MDSAGRYHEETTSHNDLYPTKLTAGSDSSQYEASQDMQQLAEDLRDCDWEQLEEKYAKAMEEHGTTEEELRTQTAKLLEVNDLQFQSQEYFLTALLQVFVAWSQTTVIRDENRALKRSGREHHYICAIGEFTS